MTAERPTAPTIDPLRLYHNVLSLLYCNPGDMRLSQALNQELLRYLPYDSYCYKALEMDSHDNRMVNYEQWPNREHVDAFSDIRSTQLQTDDPDVAFEHMLKETHDDMIRRQQQRRPDVRGFHYHALTSRELPRVVVAFLRFKSETTDNAFTQQEVDLLDELSPHIFFVVRLMTSAALNSQEYQHFKTYMQIASKITSKYGLSPMEYSIASEILFGRTNEEIAERNFISVATVKTHVQHILKKTETRNRVDFISKFFTSPQRVEL